MELLQQAVRYVFDHKSSHIDRVLGRRVGRGVGKIQLFQVRSLHAGVNRRGEYVDPFVDAVIADDLSTQQTEGLFLKHHLHRHKLSARIVAGMIHGREDHFVHIQPGFFCIGLVDAGDGGGHVKYFDDGASLRTGVTAVSAAQIVRRDPALAVGGTGERDQCVLPGDKVPDLYGVSHGVDVGCGRLHPVIDQDAALDAQFQSGFSGKSGIRRDADGKYDQISLKRFFSFEQNANTSSILFKAFHRMAQCQFYAVPAHLVVDESGHVRVKGVHQLFRALHDGDLHAQFPQVLGQFQSDEAAACQHCGFGVILIDVFFDAQGIFHGPEGKETVNVRAGDRRLRRFCSGRQEQLVVLFFKFFAGFQIFYRNRMLLWVNGGDFVAYLHGYLKSGEKALRCLERQISPVGDDVADVVRQSAVCIRDKSGPLKDDDFCLFVQPADSCGGGCSAGHAAYDYDLHIIFPPFLCRRQCLQDSLHLYIPCFSVCLQPDGSCCRNSSIRKAECPSEM